jgi:hypothetical protein
VTTTITALASATPVAADLTPFDQAAGGVTKKCTYNDVLSILTTRGNTWTGGTQIVSCGAGNDIAIAIITGGGQTTAPFILFNDSVVRQIQIPATLDALQFNPTVGSDSVSIKGSFATVEFLCLSGTILHADFTAVRAGGGVYESQNDGGALTVRPRVAVGTDGGILTIHGGDGNGSNKNGGVCRVYGGAKTGSGNSGDVLLNHNGTAAVGHLRLGSDVSAATGPVGNVVGKFQVFDSTGSSLGFIPIYDAIT